MRRGHDWEIRGPRLSPVAPENVAHLGPRAGMPGLRALGVPDRCVIRVLSQEEFSLPWERKNLGRADVPAITEKFSSFALKKKSSLVVDASRVSEMPRSIFMDLVKQKPCLKAESLGRQPGSGVACRRCPRVLLGLSSADGDSREGSFAGSCEAHDRGACGPVLGRKSSPQI